MLSHKASGNTQHNTLHKVIVKIVETAQKHICGHADVAATLAYIIL